MISKDHGDELCTTGLEAGCQVVHIRLNFKEMQTGWLLCCVFGFQTITVVWRDILG